MVKSQKTTRPITDVMGPTDTLKDDMKKAEMAVFIIEHNIPLQVMDHLSDLLSSAFPDSKIPSEFSCKHTKTPSIETCWLNNFEMN